MNDTEHLQRLAARLTDPEFYPHQTWSIEKIETHISLVFLTGSWVYKIKKPIDFGFLDFTTLDQRAHYCRREIELNQRLSSGVYDRVVEIRETSDGRLNLESDGPVVEYAVRMKQLPPQDNLQTMIEENRIDLEHPPQLGAALSDFYRQAERNPQIDAFGDVGSIERNVEENFEQIDPFVEEVLDRSQWDFVVHASRAFLRYRQPLFRLRKKRGFIRDGHGDLRAEHVYFHHGVQVIDCVEFNERFRYADVALDLAFLHMDLERLEQKRASLDVLRTYVKESGDLALYALLDFYAAYRALVRLKIACFRLDQAGSDQRGALLAEARGFFRQAYEYAVGFARPSLWVFCGPPASGKSKLSEKMAPTLALPRLDSDEMRQRALPERPERTSYGRGQYTRARRDRVYAAMINAAWRKLKQGRSVVLSATFSQEKWRREVRRLASDLDVGLLFVECVCGEEVIRERLGARNDGGDSSQARLEHLQNLLDEFEPLVELPLETHFQIDTREPIQRNLSRIVTEGYHRLQAQTHGLVLSELS